MLSPNIRTIPAADIEIPGELSGLYDLAYNLWWTWEPGARELFSAIDPVRWGHDYNPVELLINVEPQRWEALLIDQHFLASYHRIMQRLERYMTDLDGTWFRQTYPAYDAGPIAYFSTEYGWHESLGVYSGGLGILSGDHCKAASDLGIPFVGVGLMYRRGYFRQTIDADGNQQHFYPRYDLRRLPVLPVTHPNGRRVRVQVELPGRSVTLQLWKATIGRVSVVLLDSGCHDNHPADRPITSILYVSGREMRLSQEIVLGIGGVRALRALGIEPEVWHMNEGHSALMSLQRTRDAMKRGGLSFDRAVTAIREKALFTTHTPVPAGNETFDTGLVRKYLAGFAEAGGMELDDIVPLGCAQGDDDTFNLTALAIRTSRSTNGVSELHGRIADEMWKHLWPSDSPEPRVGHVTNGVHLPTWTGTEMAALLREHLGEARERDAPDAGVGPALQAVPDGELWAAHVAQKKRLLVFTRGQLMEHFARHGRSPDELRVVQDLLSPDVLTIGFARRFATYKRAALIFRDLDRLRRILVDPERPVQLLFAGKAHPADRPGQDLIREIFRKSVSAEFHRHVVFLESYDMGVARHLVQGVDLWLNTPRRPLEASGTSGMKAAINGALNFSVLDGWWCEGYDPSHGWVIGEPRRYEDPESQDREDAESLYAVLEGEIVPCFYDRDPETGLPLAWIARMRRAMADLRPRFGASRLLRDYTTLYYLRGHSASSHKTPAQEVEKTDH
jgi:starch phosphorylase